MALGLPVSAEDTGDTLGELGGIAIHPDTGKVEGFYVTLPVGFFSTEALFLSSSDILHWGTQVTVRKRSVLSPPEDFLRLQALFEDERSFLEQKIKTESGKYIGRCMDVQFDTDHFVVEWIFPRRLFQWGIALPVSEIVEVKTEAIIVRDPTPAPETVETAKQESAPLIPSISETVSRV